MILTLLRRELKVARRNWIGLAIPLLFFIIVVSLFPFAVSPDAPVLQKLAPGVIWVAALLSMLLSLEQFYRSDYQDGALEQLLLMSSPTMVATSKIIAHWLLTGLPLVILSPLLGVLMQINHGVEHSAHTWILMLSLVLGTPTLCLLGAVGMSLTLAASRNGLLVSILIIPLYVPVLIFGASTVTASLENMSYNGELAILGAFLLITLVFAPFTSGRALKISVG
ncbi:heme exporter protein CcmB [Kangiella sediminilitoris]|uniref:Heme exporter protein B n=1 Tax=Kangiella sediminilitoris TaxID=1144748 RepID=A0A1B3BA06_9GAMM|nr:heme exporter protein CcmB [Kangiella sediminilitoris]AOE49566.1 cytochrome C biogenesis protein [Kangiella sediminilitoris]